jgi:hypothetical protein
VKQVDLIDVGVFDGGNRSQYLYGRGACENFKNLR